MKFISSIILAVLLRATVILAQESEYYDDDDNAAETPSKYYDLVEAFNKRIEMYLNEIDCSVKVAGHSIPEDRYEELYNNFTIVVRQLAYDIWKKCDALNVVEMVQCRGNYITSLTLASAEFIEILYQESVTTARELNEQVKTQCLEEFMATTETLPNHFSCVVDELEAISNGNNMEQMWSKYNQRIKYFLDNWKHCDKEGDWNSLYCNVRGEFRTFMNAIRYVNRIAIANPKVFSDFAATILEKCPYV